MRNASFILLAGLFIAISLSSAPGQVVISEFMASNASTLADEDGAFEDWIEIHNTGSGTVNLLNWSLTDDATQPAKWRFPATNLAAGARLVVFASGKDRRAPGAVLHTNFRLGAGGEYLALVEPDAVTIASEFAPAFPPQVTGVSFGLDPGLRSVTLLSSNAAGRLLVPADDALGTNWILPAFDDAAWRGATSAVGFAAGPLGTIPLLGLAGNLAAYWKFDETNGLLAAEATGRSSNGTLTGFPANNSQWVAGRKDGALRFRGSPDFVRVANYPKATNALTVAAWVFAETRPAWASIAKNWGGTLAGQFHFGLRDTAGDLDIFVHTSAGDFSVRENVPLPTGSWQHVAFTAEAGTLRLFRNGQLVASGSYQGGFLASATAPLGIGVKLNNAGTAADTGAPGYWRGSIDDLAIWNRALTAVEVTALHEAAGGVFTTDLRGPMSGVNASCYLRFPFVVDNPGVLTRWRLKMRYNDGFVAWLNGEEIARRNAPDPLEWNSSAPAALPDSSAGFEEINLSAFEEGIEAGTNVLAIQGLNAGKDDPDFLLQPMLEALSVTNTTNALVYFTTPTPGAGNVVGVRVLGPVIGEVAHAPPVPLDGDDLLVTARVTPAFASVANVTLRYRVMYSNEVALPMFDDGAHGDGAAGDGLFGASIPATASASGQMVRYLVSATDALGHPSRAPLFNDPQDSDEYFGTVVQNPAIDTPLPVFHWFVQSPSAAETAAGTRSSLFYGGEFYDNIFVRLRGGTSRSFPKKSYKVEFNEDHEFLLRPGVPRVTEFDWNTTYTDKSYNRKMLAYEGYLAAGHPVIEHFHSHLRQNGSFHSVTLWTEQPDRDFLRRWGLDAEGALYKAGFDGGAGAYYETTSAGAFEKKTRRDEDKSDLQSLLNGLALSGSALENFVFDNADVPSMVNFIAVVCVQQNIDASDKNHYLYRDTRGTREWRFLPWDLDLTFGPDALNTDNIVYQLQNVSGPACASHPFIGARPYMLHASKYNRFIEAIVNVPRTRQMLLRRIRTLVEEQIASGFYQRRIDQLVALLGPDVAADRARWGVNAHFGGTTYTLLAANDRIKNEYLTPRPGYLLGTNIAGVGVSNALKQPFNVAIEVAGVEFNPASGDQAQEYVCLTNPTPFALDVTGWRVAGAIDHTFAPGTVIPSNSVLYLSPDAAAFRARPAGPRGGQGLFVQGGYQGRLSARGETLRVLNSFGQAVSAHTYAGAPSLAQQYLRVTELMYHPVALAGNTNGAEEFEYIELTNISTDQFLNLAGVRFINGVEFDFTGSGATSLAPGQRILVVKNAVAFAARYGWSLPMVAGQYTGSLENRGERIQLIDASGEEILDFSYDNQWQPITDGLGFSLVAVDERAEPDAWGRASQWRPSARLGGSPSADDPPRPVFASVVINEALTRTDAPPPTDAIELHNPSGVDADISGWFLSDDFNRPKKYRIADGASLAAGGYRVFTEADFNQGGAGFALSSDSDEAWLFSADAAGNLTGYFHGHRFGAADDGVSFGRHVISTGEEHFVAQSARTLGGANAGPRVGPVVITEILYHPPEAADGSDNSAGEFIELLNISGAAVALHDTAQPGNAWKITGGVDFVFPADQSLAAGAHALLVSFDPATNAAALAAFRASYNVAASVPVFGPYSGKLDNSSGVVELKKPATPVAGAVPFVLVDRVEYRDATPWPAAADGGGASLQRAEAGAYGNDPANWLGATPSAGGPRATIGAAPAITTHPASQTLTASSTATLNISASGAAPLICQWRRNGAALAGATNLSLTLSNIQGSDAGDYSVLIHNSAGSTLSSNATLNVIYPAFILAQPQSVSLRGSTNAANYGSTTNRSATFSVAAYSPSPISYQWRFNGFPIPGATGPSLTVSNVTLAQDGLYDAVLTDAVGSFTTGPARLSVLLTPLFVQPPVNQTVVEGSDFTMSVEVTGNPLPIAYNWRRGSFAIATNYGYFRSDFITLNSTAAGLILASNMPSSNFQMRLVVYNEANSAPGVLTTWTNTVLADFDRDGIPDVAENALGLATNNAADAALDLDGDGLSNRAEYLAGTDPANELSYLRIDQGPGAATVRVAAVSNRTYTVQFTDHLDAGGWSRLADIVARPHNRVESFTDPAWTTNRFYRVVLPAQR